MLILSLDVSAARSHKKRAPRSVRVIERRAHALAFLDRNAGFRRLPRLSAESVHITCAYRADSFFSSGFHFSHWRALRRFRKFCTMVPPFRCSPGRTRRRRAHQALKSTHTTLCPNCGAAKRSHTACSSCGFVRPGLQLKLGKAPNA